MTKQMTLMARTHSFEGSHMPVYKVDIPAALVYLLPDTLPDVSALIVLSMAISVTATNHIKNK